MGGGPTFSPTAAPIRGSTRMASGTGAVCTVSSTAPCLRGSTTGELSKGAAHSLLRMARKRCAGNATAASHARPARERVRLDAVLVCTRTTHMRICVCIYAHAYLARGLLACAHLHLRSLPASVPVLVASVSGSLTPIRPDGTQVGRWEDGWPVGEATRFSPDHKKAWRLIDGHVQGPVSMDIADLIGRMALRPKPWERAAQLARALRDKLSAMEFEQIRDLAMATIASNAKPEQANAGGLQKSDGKGAQNVKQQADAQGRLLPRAGGGAPSSPGKPPGKASSGAEGAEGGSAAKGGGGGADTDAYTAHMARVHGDRKKSPKKKRGQQSKGREGAGSPTKEGAPPDLEAGGAGGAGPLEV